MVMKKMRYSIMLLWVCLLPQLAIAGTATASLDRSITTWGESVLLRIHVDGSADHDPDLNALKKDFQILSQSQSSNYSLMNGSLSRSTEWSVNLMPKRQGSLNIPAISLGNMHTKPLSVQVVAQQPLGSKQEQDVYLEVTASPLDSYVQAQVLLVVKLFRAVNLAKAQLTEVDLPNAVIKKVGEDKNYETLRAQRRFIVTERRYAIFPERSGTLHVPALQFTGQIAGQMRMLNQGRVLRVQSKPLDIEVAPMPSNWPKSETWLPAENISIEEIPMGDQEEHLKVGEPLTRTIEIRAKGLTAEQLPTLFSHTSYKGFKQYPDKPELRTEIEDGGVIGIRREKVALIPTSAGDLVMPEISVAWWNTKTHTIQKTKVLRRTITVQKSDTQTQIPVPTTQPVLKEAQKEKGVTTPQKDSENHQEGAILWQSLAAFFAIAWLLSMLIWRYTFVARKKSIIQDDQVAGTALDVKKLYKSLEKACQSGHAKEVIGLLPQWASCFFKDDTIIYSGQLKGKSTELDQALLELETSLYGGENNSPWQGGMMLKAISELCAPTKKAQASGLKPLA